VPLTHEFNRCRTKTVSNPVSGNAHLSIRTSRYHFEFSHTLASHGTSVLWSEEWIFTDHLKLLHQSKSVLFLVIPIPGIYSTTV
jgi:hypothetical protein